MQIERDTVVDLIRQRVGDEQADRAAQVLPEQIDTDQYADQLRQFGLSPEDLSARAAQEAQATGQSQSPSWIDRIFHRSGR